MDLLDKKILCALDLNCRTPIANIAKNLRTNRNVVAYRIKNLENEGIISKYICSINLGKLGYKTFKIYFSTRGDKKFEQEFINNLKENKLIIHLIKTEGDSDYSASIVTKNLVELDQFIMKLKNTFGDYIKNYYVSIIIYSKVFKLNKLLLNEKQQLLKFDKYSSEEEQIQVDNEDILILKELSQDANKSIIEIAKNTKLGLDLIKYRLKKLNNNLINSYRLMLNFNKLGFFHYVIKLQTKNIKESDENRLFTWCAIKNNIMYCTKRIGNFDYEINVTIKNIEELNNFLREFKSEFDNIIDHYELAVNSELLKLNYIPF